VASASAGIWRVAGADWSLVLKLLRPGPGGHANWQAGDTEDHWYYWRREALAYESGLLESFGGQLRPPECQLVAERSDGNIALWLEDLGGLPGVEWAPDHYSLAARHLGQAQGEFAAGRPLPPHRWLSREWLRTYLTQRDGDLALVGDPEAWRRPPVAAWFPAPPVDELRAMRAGQDEFLAALDAMPRTICHFDLHPANLFSAGGETALIDWSFIGIGAVGVDAATLVGDAVLDFHVAPEDVDALFEHVLDGYVEGLRDAGWRGSGEQVRLGMTATTAARYAWIAPAILRAAEQEKEMLNRRPVDETLRWWAPTIDFLLRQTAQARDLLHRVGD
jgi:hypothetical protein